MHAHVNGNSNQLDWSYVVVVVLFMAVMVTSM